MLRYSDVSRFTVLLAGVMLWCVASPSETGDSGRTIYLLDKRVEGAQSNPEPQEIGRIAGAVKIALPEVGGHVLVLTEEGRVWTWGDNVYGQLGTGDTRPVAGWHQVESLTSVVAIAAGAQHSLALRQDGTVWTWGSNFEGQLGDGTLLPHMRPMQVTGLQDVVSVAAGAQFSAVLKLDGTVWVFGSNWGAAAPGEAQRILTRPLHLKGVRTEGQIEVMEGRVVEKHQGIRPELLERIAAGARLTLRDSIIEAADGWRLGWIEETERPVVPFEVPPAEIQAYSHPDGLSTERSSAERQPERLVIAGTTKIAAGANHSLQVATDGTVWAWGYNAKGQLGDGTATNRSVPVRVFGLTNVIAVAAGGEHSLALKADGTVWAWGGNSSGELGNGSTSWQGYSLQPAQVLMLADVVAIATSNYHNLALRRDGTLWAWGANGYGQLGDGTYGSGSDRATPVQVVGLFDVVAISAGGGHSLAVRQDATVWAWGDNNFGQLGVPGVDYSLLPLQVPGLTGVALVSAGVEHSLALKRDGTVWAWGWNDRGQVGDGTTTNRPSPVLVSQISNAVSIAAGAYHSLAILNGGIAMAWGENTNGQLGSGTQNDQMLPVRMKMVSGAVAITANYGHSLAVDATGRIWGCGGNQRGELATGVTMNERRRRVASPVNGMTGILAVAASNHSVITKTDGSVWSWGRLYAGSQIDVMQLTPTLVDGVSGVVSVATGYAHSVLAKTDGSVWAWGLNDSGQLGDGTKITREAPVKVIGLTNVRAVAAGAYSSLALKNDGTVWQWPTSGGVTAAQVSGLNGVVAIAAGGINALALRSDGTVWSLGSTLVQVGGLSDVTAIAVGEMHFLALKKDGTIWSCGANTNGQLGDGTRTYRASPVQVVTISGAVGIAAGGSHSLAILSDGTVRSWGDNYYGQLGDGTWTWRPRPVHVGGLRGIVALAAGATHSLAVNAGGALFAWGNDDSGQLGSGGSDIQNVPIQALQLGLPDLAISKTHAGNPMVGLETVYSLIVTNTGSSATTGLVTVSDILPPGFSYIDGAGVGWSCSESNHVVTCTNSGSISPDGASVISLTARVGASSYPAATNVATVSNSSDLNSANNAVGDPAAVGRIWPGAMTPASGNTAGQTFTFTFTNPNGYQDLGVVNILINNFLDGRYACYLAYSQPYNVLYLVNDPGTALLPGLVLNGSGSVGNNQCVVNGVGSSAVGNGDTLTLTLNMSFPPGFNGNKVVYMAARNVAETSNSGWRALGAWKVPGGSAANPSVGSVTPGRSTGLRQTLTVTFNDTAGYQDLGVMNVLINDFLNGDNACYIAYSRPAGVLYLVNDGGPGSGLSAGLALGTNAMVSNSQCMIYGATSSSSGNGNTLTLTLDIGMKATFAGDRVIYTAARTVAEVNSGWQATGSWSVP